MVGAVSSPETGVPSQGKSFKRHKVSWRPSLRGYNIGTASLPLIAHAGDSSEGLLLVETRSASLTKQQPSRSKTKDESIILFHRILFFVQQMWLSICLEDRSSFKFPHDDPHFCLTTVLICIDHGHALSGIIDTSWMLRSTQHGVMLLMFMGIAHRPHINRIWGLWDCPPPWQIFLAYHFTPLPLSAENRLKSAYGCPRGKQPYT